LNAPAEFHNPSASRDALPTHTALAARYADGSTTSASTAASATPATSGSGHNIPTLTVRADAPYASGTTTPQEAARNLQNALNGKVDTASPTTTVPAYVGTSTTLADMAVRPQPNRKTMSVHPHAANPPTG
jgi:hypothetical protein